MRLTPTNAILLATPPLLWAGNAVVGRLVVDLVPPMMLNFLRWAVAFVLLLPLAPWVLRPGSPIWSGWRHYALLGLLGVGCYNSLQYLALHTSTPMNVVLVASTLPLWMLVLGRAFFGATINRAQLAGMGLSIAGVLVVLTGGEWRQLVHWRLVPGDVLMLIATILWAWYSWLLLPRPDDPPRLRADWAALLLAQVTYGVGWSGLFAAGEWAWGAAPVRWGWPLAATLAFVAIGPAIVAYRCWGLGVQRGGPALAGVFYNLAPVFAAILSALFLGEWPHPFHGAAFALIALGIWASSRR
ncbi:MAG TPA: DMT family transporter [Ottowia sp.]|uniref:DMT family transporter n=1 Tax=Ottowia sp. TaxID=1898956 RepID=UPI002B872E56|nr:DMT family transporter [Ottowia sp.]HMN22397.1 DMT family transporter [Ottowia sp.]